MGKVFWVCFSDFMTCYSQLLDGGRVQPLVHDGSLLGGALDAHLESLFFFLFSLFNVYLGELWFRKKAGCTSFSARGAQKTEKKR